MEKKNNIPLLGDAFSRDGGRATIAREMTRTKALASASAEKTSIYAALSL